MAMNDARPEGPTCFVPHLRRLRLNSTLRHALTHVAIEFRLFEPHRANTPYYACDFSVTTHYQQLTINNCQLTNSPGTR